MAQAFLGASGSGDVAGLLMDAAVRGTIWLVLVFGAAVVLRRASAAARHLVWVVGLMGLVAIPVVSDALPWHWPVLPGASETMALQEGVQERPVDRPTVWLDEALPAAEVIAPDAVEGPGTLPASGATGSASMSGTDVEVTGAAAGLARLWGTMSLASLLTLVWVAGAVVVLLRLVSSMLAMRRLVKRSEPVEELEWDMAVLPTLTRFGASTTRLRRSADVSVPMAAGLTRPVILLPGAAEAWTPEQRRAVLLHEAAHVHRRDLVTALLSRVVCALYWFHPLVWLAAARVRAEAERACDDHVLGAGTRPSTYADHLLSIVRGVGQARVPMAAIPLARRSEFEGRLLAILEDRHVPRGLRRLHGAAIILALSVTAVPLSAATRRAEAGPPSEPTMTPPAVGMTLPEAAAASEGPATQAQAEPPSVPEREPAARSAPSPAGATAAETAATTPEPDAAPAAEGAEPVAEAPDSEPVVLEQAQAANEAASLHRRIAALASVLADEATEVRAAAVQALGELQDTGAIAALATALRNDVDAEVRRMAAWSLGEIEDARAVAPLGAALLDDANAEVRRTAAWALGQIEDVAALEPLLSATADEAPRVRDYVIWALAQIEDPRAVGPVSQLLGDENVEVRRRAVWALGQFEDPSVLEPLMDVMVRDEDAEVRYRAADALGDLNDPRAATALEAALADPVAEVRKEAIDALHEVGVTQAPQALLAAAGDEDAEVRQMVAHTLGEMEDPAGVPVLRDLLRDPELDVRRQAISALGDIGGDEVVDVLIEALQDDDPEIRRLAARALGRRGGW